ncbi:MAG: bifunctional 5,10-methylenetetrahydrofolate dehydrogenase/5,10-methenyltetrahydrofolate cyclohydrolase [Anaerolineaceae bacterium]|nr:bifunctional 5,10-methylenetetrahydrofolate dehydrogenase/5,10-methenyltetrahydrofolate cyclohydrolase [Anaerolineaceae bacterium]
MSAIVIDGKSAANSIREAVKAKIIERVTKRLPIPGLATVLVGDDPASQSYVRAKHSACEEAGIRSFAVNLPVDISQQDLDRVLSDLAKDSAVHGILVQLPLPKGLDEENVLKAVPLEKDVDGFHPVNMGRLAQKGRQPLFVPCTPSGVIYLLKEYTDTLVGKQAVDLGRSNIVGMPVSLLLIKENATVTICHSRTEDISTITKKADILVAAIGRPEMVKGDWIKPGAVVIDVGVNRVDDSSKKRGYRLVGDVDFGEALNVASAITPVPGGVGPVTIAMLMKNTLIAAERADA